MMHQLLLDLPTSVAAEIVNQWLGVKDRVRLDAAHCQASNREEFLELMRRPEFFVKSWVHKGSTRCWGTTDKVVSWALRRGLYIEKVSIGRESNPHVYSEYLEKFAKGILVVKLSTTTFLTQTIARCCNLLVLDFRCYKLPSSLYEVLKCCKDLRKFTCHGSSTNRVQDGPSARTNDQLVGAYLENLVCANLKYLDLSLDTELVGAFLHMAVAVEVIILVRCEPLDKVFDKICPTVHTLSLEQQYLDKGFQDIATRCTNLVNLALIMCNFTESGAQCIGRFPNLRSLDLTDSHFESGSYLDVLSCSYGDQLTELLLYFCIPLDLADVQEVQPRFTQLKSFSTYIDSPETVSKLSFFGGFAKLLIGYSGEDSAALFAELAKHCHTNLRELSIHLVESEFDGESVDIIVSACTQLVTLNLTNEYGEVLGYQEDEERWQGLNSKLNFGCDCSLCLSVFDD